MNRTAEHPWQARLPFFYGWIIVSLGFISALFGIGLTWAAGLFAVPMHAELGWSRSAIFFAISLRGWIGIGITPFVGRYIDRPNGARVLAVAGGLVNTLSLLLIARMTAEWQFILLFGVIGGVAQSIQGFLSIAVVPKWFIRQRGLAVSISTAGGGLAAFIMPAVINGFSAAAGWRGAWALLGVAALVLGTIPSLLIQRQPEDVGLLPDGERVEPNALRTPARRAEPAFTLHDAVHSRTFWLLIAGVSFGGLSSNGIPSNIAAIFVDRGFAFATAGAALMWYGVASVGAKFAWGWLANRFRLRSVLLALLFYGVLALPVILLIPAGVGTLSLGYGFLVGSFVGAYVPLTQLLWADFFGRAHVGAISAVARPFAIATMSGGPFLLAFTRDLSGSYNLGILINALAVAVCLLCLYLVRPMPHPAPVEEPAPIAPASA